MVGTPTLTARKRERMVFTVFFVCPEERHFEHSPSSPARSVRCLRVLNFSHLDEMCSLEQNLQFFVRMPGGRTEESGELGAATAATTLGLTALEFAMEAYVCALGRAAALWLGFLAEAWLGCA